MPSILSSKLYRAAASGGLPRNFGDRCHLFRDLTRRDLMQIRRLALITGGKFLETADHASLDFTTAMTVVVWRNPTTNATDQGFVSKWENGSQQAYALTSGGSANQAHSLKIWLSDTVSQALPYTLRMADSSPPWSMGAATYAATTPKLYADGVQVTSGLVEANAGNLPATLAQATATLKLGKLSDSFYRAESGLGRVALFNRELSAAEILALWNNGLGYSYAEAVAAGFNLTGLVAWYDCDETSGQRSDDSGNGRHLAESGGTIDVVECVQRLIDAGPHHFQYHAVPLLGDQSVVGLAGAPRLRYDIITGRPLLSLVVNSSLYCATGTASNPPLNLTHSDVLYVARYPSFNTSESVSDCSSSENHDNDQFFTGEYFTGSAHRFRLRIEDQEAGSSVGDGSVDSTTAISTDTTYLNNWRMLGKGGAASFEHRLNGVGTTVAYSGTTQNSCWASVRDRGNLLIGSIVGPSSVAGNGALQYLGDCAIFSGLTVAENRALERWLAERYRIAV